MSNILLFLSFFVPGFRQKFVIHGHLRLCLSGPLYCHSDGKQSDSHSGRARVGSLEVASIHESQLRSPDGVQNTVKQDLVRSRQQSLATAG